MSGLVEFLVFHLVEVFFEGRKVGIEKVQLFEQFHISVETLLCEK